MYVFLLIQKVKIPGLKELALEGVLGFKILLYMGG